MLLLGTRNVLLEGLSGVADSLREDIRAAAARRTALDTLVCVALTRMAGFGGSAVFAICSSSSSGTTTIGC